MATTYHMNTEYAEYSVHLFFCCMCHLTLVILGFLASCLWPH